MKLNTNSINFSPMMSVIKATDREIQAYVVLIQVPFLILAANIPREIEIKRTMICIRNTVILIAAGLKPGKGNKVFSICSIRIACISIVGRAIRVGVIINKKM